MPIPIQILPPAIPLKKSIQPKPIANDPIERDQPFEQALKSASKKAEEPQPLQKKSKPEKVSKEKATAKASTKAAKPKNHSSQSEDTQATDESPDAQSDQATDAAAESQDLPQLPVEEDAPTDATPKPKSTAADPKSDPDHPEVDPALASAAAQAVQPIDAHKDRHPDHADPDQKDQANQDSDEQAAQAATTKPSKSDPAITLPVAATKTDPRDSAQPNEGDHSATTQAIPGDDPAASDQTTDPAKPTTPAHTPDKTNPDPNLATPANPPQTKTTLPDPSVASIGDDQDVPLQPRSKTQPTSKTTGGVDTDSSINAANAFSQLISPDPTAPSKPAPKSDLSPDPTAVVALDAAPTPHAAQSSAAGAPPAVANTPVPTPEVDFAQANHDKIVSEVRGQLLPHGGAMQIRLDPPELGALKVMVEMRDGVMNATFQTSNENATQLLSHSLNQLKHVLESQGVSVERLQVQQAPKTEHNTPQQDPDQQQQRDANDQHTAQQEQQRKELLRRMWRKVNGAGDPVDYFA